jgi:hypothetical protein
LIYTARDQRWLNKEVLGQERGETDNLLWGAKVAQKGVTKLYEIRDDLEARGSKSLVKSRQGLEKNEKISCLITVCSYRLEANPNV